VNAVADREQIVVGKTTGLHGLGGWVKVFSYTDPKENIFEYRPIMVGDVQVSEFETKRHGQMLLIRFDPEDDRTSAAKWVGREMVILRDQLPQLPEGEYYQSDLIGFTITNTHGEELGRLKAFMSTGAHDVMLVDGDQERLIPYVKDHFVLDVSLKDRHITVDWELDY